ncbi:MAG: hypothetical protein V2A71_01030 [Candidatus Eisenbacteria bacterium]
MAEFTETLKSIALSSAMTSFGTAVFSERQREAPETPPFSLGELPYAIAIGYRLSDVVLDSLADRPTRTYQYHYRQVNLLLDQTLLKLLARIHEYGFRGFPVPASQIVDWQAGTGHLSHKFVAREAGLGWIGRNNLLVSPVHGARVRYGSLFTNMPLERTCVMSLGGREELDSRVEDTGRGGTEGAREAGVGTGTQAGVVARVDDQAEAGSVMDCGSCRKCVKACPAGAIADDGGAFDLGKCKEMLKTFSRTENIGSMICGVCIKACSGRKP